MLDFIKRHEGLWLFTRSPAVIISALIAIAIIIGAVFAPWIAPLNPYDLSSFSLMDGLLPPMWEEFGTERFPLGTDDQGRDMISSILYGARLSLIIASVLGVGLGLAAGYFGGRFDAIVIRIGMQFLLSGEWWILWIPTLFLVALVVSINVLGDFLRDVFNPRLR